MNSSAIYEKCKSRELVTSFNYLDLCTSYKETKFFRNNLAKLAISRSSDTGIPLPTHFSKRQFTIAAMDNFDHSDFNSSTGTAGTRDTAMTLFQIKPESCCVKPLKLEINLKDIDSISLPCQQRESFSSNKCITIPDTFKVKCELISEQEETVNLKLDDFSLNVLKNSKLVPNENLPTWGTLNSLISNSKLTDHANRLSTFYSISCNRTYNRLHCNEKFYLSVTTARPKGFADFLC